MILFGRCSPSEGPPLGGVSSRSVNPAEARYVSPLRQNNSRTEKDSRDASRCLDSALAAAELASLECPTSTPILSDNPPLATGGRGGSPPREEELGWEIGVMARSLAVARSGDRCLDPARDGLTGRLGRSGRLRGGLADERGGASSLALGSPRIDLDGDNERRAGTPGADLDDCEWSKVTEQGSAPFLEKVCIKRENAPPLVEGASDPASRGLDPCRPC